MTIKRKIRIAFFIILNVFLAIVLGFVLFKSYQQYKFQKYISEGDTYFQKKDYDKAENAYFMAQNVDSTKMKSYIKLEKNYINQEEYEKSIEILKKAEKNVKLSIGEKEKIKDQKELLKNLIDEEADQEEMASSDLYTTAEEGEDQNASGSTEINTEGTEDDNNYSSQQNSETSQESPLVKSLLQMEQQNKNDLSSAKSQKQRIRILDSAYKEWDKKLNEIYQDLMGSLSTNEANSLREQERTWIKRKESTAASAGSSNSEAYKKSLYESTKTRVYELANRLE